MEVKLKPCPECGEYPKFTVMGKGSHNNRRLEYGIVCSNSECPWNRFSIMYASRDKAIEEWNKKVIRHQESKTNTHFHPGTPTEKGWYILAYRYGSEDAEIEYIALEWDGVWKDKKVGWDALKVFDLGWQKFDEFKEE